jgi:Ala-tRNA(Pro) deacylase
MALKTLTDFLDQHRVRYAVIRHSPAYTAQEIAESVHVPGKQFAKTVIVEIDGRMAMAVVPATTPVHTEMLRRATGAKSVVLAAESDFSARFPDCELGAMPPFGNLYDMEVFVSQHLAEDEQICFNAGTHHEVLRMAYQDFANLTKPVPVNI